MPEKIYTSNIPHFSSLGSIIPLNPTSLPRAQPPRSALPSSLSVPQLSLQTVVRSASSPVGISTLNSSPSSPASSVLSSPSNSPLVAGSNKFRSLRTKIIPFTGRFTGSGPVVTPPSSLSAASGLKHKKSSSVSPSPASRTNIFSFASRNSSSTVKVDSKQQFQNRAVSLDYHKNDDELPVIAIERPTSTISTDIEGLGHVMVASGDNSPTPPPLHVLEEKGLPAIPPSSPLILAEQSNGQENFVSLLDLELPESKPDLSTIMESDLSSMSISKHIPPIDSPLDRSDLDVSTSEIGDSESKDVEEQHLLPLSNSRARNRPLSEATLGIYKDYGAVATPPVVPSEAVDQFPEPFELHTPDDKAPSYGVGNGKQGARLLQDSSTTRSQTSTTLDTRTNMDDEPQEQISFNLSSLDPDLAALLSPNNLSSHPDGPVFVNLDIPSLPPPLSSSHSPSIESSDIDPLFHAGSTSGKGSSPQRLLVAREIGSQSSPPRKSRKNSSPRTASSGSTPEPLYMSGNDTLGARSSATLTSDLESQPGKGTNTANRSLLARSVSSAGASSSTSLLLNRRTVTPRLNTPNRPRSAAGHLDTERRVLREFHDVERNSDGSVITPRASTALGMAGPSSRFRSPLSEDTSSTPDLSTFSRSRRRSMSVNASLPSQYQNRYGSTDWLGPRTARAFAAAGLLGSEDGQDQSSDTGFVRPFSRSAFRKSRKDYGLSRSISGVDSLYSTLKPNITDPRDTDMWSSSGQGTRKMTMAELAPRRGSSSGTYSSSPTALSQHKTGTTLSMSTTTSFSSGSVPLDSALQALQERHQMEMAALLNALADSQRTTTMLREENSQLRERLQAIEDDFKDFAERLQSPSSLSSSRVAHGSSSSARPTPTPTDGISPKRRPRVKSPLSADLIPPSVEASPRRLYHAHSSFQGPSSSSTAHVNNERSLSEAMSPSITYDAVRTTRQRSSTASTSSMIPTVPADMSLLMHEAGSADLSGLLSSVGSRPSSPPPSPTLTMGRFVASSQKIQHVPKKSISSADFSVISSAGSPGSLHLRPEHELHLGDMTSLDLEADDD